MVPMPVVSCTLLRARLRASPSTVTRFASTTPASCFSLRSDIASWAATRLPTCSASASITPLESPPPPGVPGERISYPILAQWARAFSSDETKNTLRLRPPIVTD